MEKDLFVSVTVVYFDQCLGAAQSKRWLKSPFSVFLKETDSKMMQKFAFSALFLKAGQHKNASLAP